MSFDFIIILIGLVLFEVISSVDNAVINADVLRTMSERARRWFLLWGILIAVFLVRGILPTVIVWIAAPSLGFWGAFSASFSGDAHIIELVEKAKPILLIGGGMYLVLLFLHWLFEEGKEYAFFLERFVHRQAVWFYTFASVLLVVIAWFAILNPLLIFAALVGSTAFFLTSGFKRSAEEQEKKLLSGSRASNISKLLYLEVLDATFSIDGVIGAFAFTTSVPLILLGNGIGAFVVRYITIKGVNTVKKFRYLKNGAMYAVGILGLVMVLESFGREIAFWVAPLNTAIIITTFFFLSWRALRARVASDR
ncbi:MAG: DUF475 domain-containing protein [Candidatus Spechtbacterales bacterium]